MDKTLKIEFAGGKAVNALLDGHRIRTDQPVASGGGASAPTPMDLFLAAIGTCAGLSAVAYCESRDIPTESLGLEVLCTRSATEPRFEKVELKLSVPADFSEKHRIGIERAMNLCSVKRHILSPPEFALRIEPSV